MREFSKDYLLQGGRSGLQTYRGIAAFSGITWLLVLIFLTLSAPVEAQLFGRNNPFSKKPEAPRELTEDEIGVPVPVTGRVEALKGHEVTFEIRAETKTPAAGAEFLIRVFPSAGKIVSMVSNPGERNKALVTYWADPNSSATKDAFSFAVRYRGGRYSSEMRFDIDLVDLHSELQVPASVDFGEVMVGGEEIREIIVRNLGNGSTENQLYLTPPWHLVEPADGKLVIGANGSRVLKIAFRPELMGETSYFLSLSRTKTGTTKLIGVGGDPFQVVTDAIELTIDESSRERRGEIELRNPGAKPVLLEARASTRLQGHLSKDGYVITPGDSIRVPVKLVATDTAPFDGTVEFYLKNGYSKSVRVLAPVVPAHLEVTVADSLTSELINFGKVEAGRSLEREITVTNRGGVGVPLAFHLPEPFRLLTKPGPQLAPLSSVKLTIGLFPTDSARGLVDVTMNVKGSDQVIPIRLLGNIIAPTGRPTRPAGAATNLPKGVRFGGTHASAAATEEVAMLTDAVGESQIPPQATVSQVGSTTLDPADPVRDPEKKADRIPTSTTPIPVERKVDPGLRRPEDLIVLKAGSSSLELGWTAPRNADSSHFDVEIGRHADDSQGAESQMVWTPYSNVKIETINRLVKAKLTKLESARRYELRVIMTTQDGFSSPPSETIVANTTLPMDSSYIYVALGIVLLGGIGFAIYRIRKTRKPTLYPSEYVDL